MNSLPSVAILSLVASFASLAPAMAQDCSPHATEIASQPLPSQTPRQMMMGLTKSQSVPDSADVVLVGDSLVEGWGDAKADFGGKSVWNFGVNGDRTQQVIWRLSKANLSKLRPESVVLLIGSNNLVDGGTTACSASAGIDKVVEMIRSSWPSANVFVLTIPPRGKDFRGNDEERLALNQHIKALSDNDKKVYPIVLGDDELTCGLYSNQNLLPSLEERCLAPDSSICANFKADGIHFTPAGYSLIRKTMKEFSETRFGQDVFGNILPKADAK
ncbi:hypothetical protein H6M51_23725 [Rhizobium sp. AQ_MP]|uniref:GDSL-type esterase/lipase family protein n=1 Tax=Rhizobium sp. AQ_MP TaxID=2761536 RepID=UPI00163AC1CD|nr:GDSL-type esterase/lipase family protein [Rhizobium sp. AQ_MP]MBC2775871.1 hypothetical protein [Rhizobium sp. AQ_MP]